MPNLDESRAAAFSRISSMANLVGAEATRIQGEVENAPELGEDLRILAETLRLWASVLDDPLVQKVYAYNPDRRAPLTWIHNDHLDFLEKELPKLEPPFYRDPLTALGNHLRNLLGSILKNAEVAAAIAREDPEQIDYRRVLEFQLLILTELQKLDSEVLVHAVGRVNSAADATEKDAKAVARVAGKTAEDGMSSFYDAMATREEKSANVFRRLTVTMVFSAAAATALFILGPTWGWGWFELPEGDYVHLIQRAILLAGLFALSGYFARQAHQHRSMANWAGSLAVQLQTFDAYLAAVENPEVKDELRKTFGSRVFGDHPPMKGEPAVTPSTAAMDTAVGWMTKLTGGGK